MDGVWEIWATAISPDVWAHEQRRDGFQTKPKNHLNALRWYGSVATKEESRSVFNRHQPYEHDTCW